MKKQPLILIALLLGFTSAFAQNLKPNSTIRANKITFRTDNQKMHGTASNFMSVVNIDNSYYGRIPKNRNPDITFDFTDRSALLKAVKQTFSNDRLKQLLPEKRIDVTFYVSAQGKVLDVSFIVNKNTLLTAVELENLENIIKANLSFKIEDQDKKYHDFFDISYPIIYQRILNNQL